MLIRLSIHLYLADLYILDTVRDLERFGVHRARSTVPNWIQKAELQPEGGKLPDHIAVDETVIQLTDERYWLFAAVDPETNKFLHVRLFPTRSTALNGIFLNELSEKNDVDNAVFFIDFADWLKAAIHRRGYDFRYERHSRRNSVEHVFQEVKR